MRPDLSVTDKDSRLLREHSHLFPSSPLQTHDAPKGRSHADIIVEKDSLYTDMMFSAQSYTGASRSLMEASARLAVLLHFNQFRSGPDTPVYLSHVKTVGDRAAAAIAASSESFPVICDALGTPIEATAIGHALGRLHDTREDFWTNFEDGTIDRDVAAEVAEAKVRVELSRAVGASAAEEIVARINILSLTNHEEFPDRDYVDRIIKDPFTKYCKGADYSHNLETFPGYTETYPLLIVPAQYLPIVNGTSFEQSYEHGLLMCLDSYRVNEIAPWGQEEGAQEMQAFDLIVSLFAKYNEPDAFARLKNYYSNMLSRIEGDSYSKFLTEASLHKGHLVSQVRLLLDEIVERA